MMKKAFSLIELLVVISIMATLTAILLPNFMGARERALDAQKIQDMSSLKNALRLYYNDNQHYPAGEGVLTSDDVIRTALEKYTSSTGIGISYWQVDDGDGFQMCVSLDSNQGGGGESLIKCGINTKMVCGLETPSEKIYAVCAN